jgi:hypothetical protein
MTELPAPERIAVIWSPEGRVDLRAIDHETAMQILHCVDRYLASRSGDVKKLNPPRTGFRLRCRDYRVFFDQKNDTTITIRLPRSMSFHGPASAASRKVNPAPSAGRQRQCNTIFALQSFDQTEREFFRNYIPTRFKSRSSGWRLASSKLLLGNRHIVQH